MTPAACTPRGTLALKGQQPLRRPTCKVGGHPRGLRGGGQGSPGDGPRRRRLGRARASLRLAAESARMRGRAGVDPGPRSSAPTALWRGLPYAIQGQGRFRPGRLDGWMATVSWRNRGHGYQLTLDGSGAVGRAGTAHDRNRQLRRSRLTRTARAELPGGGGRRRARPWTAGSPTRRRS